MPGVPGVNIYADVLQQNQGYDSTKQTSRLAHLLAASLNQEDLINGQLGICVYLL